MGSHGYSKSGGLASTERPNQLLSLWMQIHAHPYHCNFPPLGGSPPAAARGQCGPCLRRKLCTDEWWPPAHRHWHAGDISQAVSPCHRPPPDPARNAAGAGRLVLFEWIPLRCDRDARSLGRQRAIAAGAQALHDRIGRTFEANGAKGMARISIGFLRKYRSDLMGQVGDAIDRNPALI
jgi:hypothetical protein